MLAAIAMLAVAGAPDSTVLASFAGGELQCRSEEAAVSLSPEATATLPVEAPAPYCSASEMLTNPACAYPAAPMFPVGSTGYDDQRLPASVIATEPTERLGGALPCPLGMGVGPSSHSRQPPTPPPRRR